MTPRRPSTKSIHFRLLGAALFIIAAAIAGLVLGEWSVNDEIPLPPGPITAAQQAAQRIAEQRDSYMDPEAPPLYFQSAPKDENAWKNTEGQIALAAQTGIHQYILPLPLGWNSPVDEAAITAIFDRVAKADPLAAILFQVDCNPPSEWLQANPNAQIVAPAGPQPFATPSSPAWRNACASALEGLCDALNTKNRRARTIGIVLHGLEGGWWSYPAGPDTSHDSKAAFRTWLQGIYADDTALQTAWGDPAVSIETATIPDTDPAPATPARVFFRLPEGQRNADYARFRSESIADALAGFASHLRAKMGTGFKIFAAAGHGLERPKRDSGHHALGLLLGANFDGVLSPVSAIDRGLGGAGGPAGAIDSPRYRVKQWVILDDTRTGVTRDPLTGEIKRLRGLRSEEVFNVQRRNFAAALTHGIGLAWSDPQGEGWLYDSAQWDEFARMRAIYDNGLERQPDATDAAQPDAAQPRVPNSEPSADPDTLGLLVILDELSALHAREASPWAAAIIQARDAALRAGVSTQFALMQDFLDGRTPPARACLFLNAFLLSDQQRAAIHAPLAAMQALAIWCYAPGYLPEGTPESIAKTVKMKVYRRDVPAAAGSAYSLSGGWLEQNAPIGETADWDPLFYIDDPDVDVLAVYRETAKSSVATRYIEDGWTSVYVAEPNLTAPLLREILRIQEQPTFFRVGTTNYFDTTHAGRGFLAIHSQQVGERAITLPQIADIIDAMVPETAWQQRDTLLLPLRMGETRILRIQDLP